MLAPKDQEKKTTNRIYSRVLSIWPSLSRKRLKHALWTHFHGGSCCFQRFNSYSGRVPLTTPRNGLNTHLLPADLSEMNVLLHGAELRAATRHPCMHGTEMDVVGLRLMHICSGGAGFHVHGPTGSLKIG